MRTHEKAAVYKPGREPSPETEFAQALIMDFWSPEVWKNKCLLLKPPGLWYFVMVAWADEYK